MPYVTLEDLKALIQDRDILDLTNDAGTAADLSDQDVAAILADVFDQASQEIDAHLAAVADVPLATPPRIVRQLAARIARYRLYQRRPNLGETFKPVAKDYDNAVAMLGQFAAGALKLPGTIDGQAVVADDSGLTASGCAPLFGDAFWKRMP